MRGSWSPVARHTQRQDRRARCTGDATCGSSCRVWACVGLGATSNARRLQRTQKQCDLPDHCVPRRERHRCRQAEELTSWVEKPDLREFNGKVGEEDEFRAGPLFGKGGHFMLYRHIVSPISNPKLEQKSRIGSENVRLESYTSENRVSYP